MDKSMIAKLMFKTAKRDVFMGKGRVIPHEFLRAFPICFVGNPQLTINDLILAWKEIFPNYPITQKMNVLIIDLHYEV